MMRAAQLLVASYAVLTCAPGFGAANPVAREAEAQTAHDLAGVLQEDSEAPLSATNSTGPSPSWPQTDDGFWVVDHSHGNKYNLTWPVGPSSITGNTTSAGVGLPRFGDWTPKCREGTPAGFFGHSFLEEHGIDVDTPGVAIWCPYHFEPLKNILTGEVILEISGSVTVGLTGCPPTMIFYLHNDEPLGGHGIGKRINPSIRVSVNKMFEAIGVDIPKGFPDVGIEAGLEMNPDSRQIVLAVELQFLGLEKLIDLKAEMGFREYC